MQTAPSKADDPRSARPRYARILVLLVIATAAAALLLQAFLDRIIQPVLHGLESEMNVAVSYSTSRLYLAGLVLRDVRVALAPDPLTHRSRGIIKLDHIDFRPSARGLLWGRPGFPWTVTAALYEGTATLTIDARANASNERIHWTGIDIAGLSTLLDIGKIAGTSDGHLLLTARDDEHAPRRINGSWAIGARQIESARLRGGHLVLPPMVVSDLHTAGSWAGRQVIVARLDASGSFGNVGLTGKIVIRTPLEKSALSMRMTHTWPAEIDPALGILIRMLLPDGDTGGPKQYRVTGTLSAPTITPAPPL